MKKNQSEWKKGKHRIQFGRMQKAMILFGLLIMVLLIERHNIGYETSKRRIDILDNTLFSQEKADKNAECLLIWSSEQDNSVLAEKEMQSILGEMKISYDKADVSAGGKIPLGQYDKIVLGLDSFAAMGEQVLDLFDYIEEGTHLLLLYPPASDSYWKIVSSKTGIRDIGDDNYTVGGIRFRTDFMIGGSGKDYKITDAYDSAVTVTLAPESEALLVSADENELPLIWKYTYGKGDVVVVNLNYFEKAFRGFYAAAYSLLGEVCVYPVINASAFYLDDFPSPVPGGEGEYIERDYGMDIKTFYTNEWWPDICRMAEEYGIRYTGLVIENYSDENKAPYEGNEDIQRYRYFGNKLLDNGGEIGFHGYNHMPLVLKNFDYKDQFDSYRQWNSMEDMKQSVEELSRFCHQMFPDEKFQVYVPPSNILSEEGRKMLAEEFPEIKTIAGIYFPGEFEYTQDFAVAEDGIIETPRIISGYIIDSYMEIAALSELNMHYVNSHFQHPDDVLDVDRGAAQGWEHLRMRLEEYVAWLYNVAPDIRNLTGSEMAGAVQRFYYVDPQVETNKNQIRISLSGFQDEAWLLVRINNGKPIQTEGGALTEVADNLYLLEAFTDSIVIYTEEGR